MPVLYSLNLSIQPQGLHYNAPNRPEGISHFRTVTTCGKKPHHHAGIKYDKIPIESPATGELGLKVILGQQLTRKAADCYGFSVGTTEA